MNKISINLEEYVDYINTFPLDELHKIMENIIIENDNYGKDIHDDLDTLRKHSSLYGINALNNLKSKQSHFDRLMNKEIDINKMKKLSNDIQDDAAKVKEYHLKKALKTKEKLDHVESGIGGTIKRLILQHSLNKHVDRYKEANKIEQNQKELNKTLDSARNNLILKQTASDFNHRKVF